MNLTYRCKHLNLGKGVTVKSPLLPVALIGRKSSINVNAILDSGSDFILIPLEVAEAINLKFDKNNPEKAKVYTGETITTSYSNVDIKIRKGREQMGVRCRCAVQLEEHKQHEDIILGSTFFEHFKIVFDYPHNKFQIKSVSKKY